MATANSSTVLQAQNQIMNVSKEEVYRLVNYLYLLQGDRFATGDEYQTMLNDANHARETVYQMAQHGDASVIHAFLSGQNVETVTPSDREPVIRGGLNFENPEVFSETGVADVRIVEAIAPSLFVFRSLEQADALLRQLEGRKLTDEQKGWLASIANDLRLACAEFPYGKWDGRAK